MFLLSYFLYKNIFFAFMKHELHVCERDIIKTETNDCGYTVFVILTNHFAFKFSSQTATLRHKSARFLRSFIDGPLKFVKGEFDSIKF